MKLTIPSRTLHILIPLTPAREGNTSFCIGPIAVAVLLTPLSSLAFPPLPFLPTISALLLEVRHHHVVFTYEVRISASDVKKDIQLFAAFGSPGPPKAPDAFWVTRSSMSPLFFLFTRNPPQSENERIELIKARRAPRRPP
ncbi:hypothetical protein [Pajaroellobacter abortibovis]|uniref:Uncharacterized protein n=1 Tax=Pajaroellobacter abortibovis TaxID=1882918 RepID=A0A1L6MYS9_9BACT|nr:hypothetical protein [Pajaroellobacter abortibovis]APS00578.1 hypothetical protein BCY86_07745 [Pajaroellobacter abortibovis]